MQILSPADGPAPAQDIERLACWSREYAQLPPGDHLALMSFNAFPLVLLGDAGLTTVHRVSGCLTPHRMKGSGYDNTGGSRVGHLTVSGTKPAAEPASDHPSLSK